MINVSNLQFDAYRSIMHKIMTLELLPGEKIVEKKIIEELKMSRTPVREAILKLRNDGLMYSIPQSGTFVSKINMESAENARYIRQTLEMRLFSSTINVVTAYDIEQLREIIKREQIFLANKEYDLFFKEDEAFHKYFYQMADKLLAWETVQNISHQLNRYRWIRLKVAGLSWGTLDHDYESIVDALEAGNDTEIKRLVGQHDGLMLQEQDDVIKNYPEYFE